MQEKFDFRWMQVTNERRNEMKELGLKPLFALNVSSVLMTK